MTRSFYAGVGSGICAWAVTLMLAGGAVAQESSPAAKESHPAAHKAPAEGGKPLAASQSATTQTATAPAESKEPVVTHRTVTIDGKAVAYTATAGFLAIRDEAGKPDAEVFYTAYVKDGAKAADRPILFAFNGGPGAASLWLHLGVIGPRRVVLPDDGKVMPAKVELVDNEYSWLDVADLVFVDPVGAGYSVAASGVEPRKFFGVEGDVRAMGEFIRLYVSKNERWLSPKYLAGESYGTTRSAGLARYLQRSAGMGLKGLVLVSSALNFQTIAFGKGNDTPYMLYLPTYAAIAWYHGRLAPELQKDLAKTLAQAEQWTLEEYGPALARGDALPAADRKKIVAGMHRFTGLSEPFIESSNLRVSSNSFAKELLRAEGKLVGFLDGRATGYPIDPASSHMDYDPSMFLATEPFVAGIQSYIRGELGFVSERRYVHLSRAANASWDWGSAAGGYVNVADDLQAAMCENSGLKVLACLGTFDLTTGYFAQKYMFTHLGLPAALRANITYATYPSGHMMYVHLPSLKQMKADVAAFVK